MLVLKLGGRFGYFLFFLLGEGGGGVRGSGRGGGRFFWRGRGSQGREGPRPGGCLQRIGEFFFGGGAKYFFFGPEMSTK